MEGAANFCNLLHNSNNTTGITNSFFVSQSLASQQVKRTGESSFGRIVILPNFRAQEKK